MIKIKSFLQNIDNLIEPYKKWIMFLLVNLYYPFSWWYSTENIYGPEVNRESFGPLGVEEIILIGIFFLAIILYYILSNLVVFFSYKAQYKNIFLISYNILLLGILAIYSYLIFINYYNYKKSISFVLIGLLLLWFYLGAPLIYKLWKLPINPAKKNAKTFF